MNLSFVNNMTERTSVKNWIVVPLIVLAVAVCFAQANARESADIIVAKDGSGNFTTIQAAVDSVPKHADKMWIIFIKNGTYNEKVLITKSNIALAGEDKDSTRIEYAELRSNWRKDHTSDIGAAVISIGNNVTDLTIANLTVYNNYGALHDSHDHQFAIRGGGKCTRIIVVNCNVWADGGDTMSLWNPESGMYYQANCSFKGYVDYVCPRGWCYITESKFYGYNSNASIWHDGSVDSTSKFVIRNSSFDGISDFPLGRYHKDAQFYLLDCRFSKNMADSLIYPVVEPSKYRWGQRTYFYDCHREGGDFSWFKDNLQSAYGGPVKESDVTAAWTFKGEWNPERTMMPVLPFASLPTPRNNHPDFPLSGSDSLHWIGARNAISYDVYFGNSSEPKRVGNQKETFYVPSNLALNTTYRWRVDAVTDGGTIKGETWVFTTATGKSGSK